MYHHFKRIFALLLICVVSATFFSACGNGNTEIKDPTQSQEDLNLYGATLTIAQFTSNTTTIGDPLHYVAKTLMAETALKRLDDIEKKLNCEIKIDYYDGGQKSLLIAGLVSYPPICDIVLAVDEECVLTQGEVLLPILDYNDIIGYDSSTFEIYGPPNLLQVGMYKGQLYYVIPYSHPGKQIIGGKYFSLNVNLIKEYNNGLDIREYYELGNWNWANFEQIIKDTTVVENSNTLLYGVGCNANEITDYALISNGFTRIAKTADGRYVANYNTDNTLEALEWINKLKRDYSENIKFETRSEMLEDFEAENVAMVFMTTGYIRNKISFLSHEFAVLPFPVGPKGNWATNVASTACSGFAIYKMTEYPEAAARIIHDYCQPFEDYPSFEKALEYEKDIFWDSRDVQVIVDVQRNSSYVFGSFNGNVIANNFGSANNMSPQQCLDSYGQLLDKCIEDWLIPAAELTDQLLAQ